ncbi:radical SAM protein [Candidatus Fermentibacteria bacterium]|nr:radical SAM protein [Candidatus Fermentibacteria bacterium]
MQKTIETSAPEPAVVCSRVELQLLTTLQCNLRCSYCSLGEGDVLASQRNATYTPDQLAAFIEKHFGDREVYITLYGGEPTLNTEFGLALMRRFPLLRFNMQTNGTLLSTLPDDFLGRLSNIMVSIDGGEKVTDDTRGRGVYRRVIENVTAIRPRMPGTITARITWWSGGTSFEDIDGLTGHFDYVYFQFAQERSAYPPGSVDSRKAVLTKLIERFFEGDRLYPIVPVMGAVRNKLVPSRLNELSAGMTQCRVSTNLINVMPDGKVYPCPDMLYAGELLQGDVVENWVRRSPLQPTPDIPCRECGAYHFCSGNCMKNLYLAYVKKNDEWRTKVTEPICSLIRFMGEEIDRHDPAAWYARMPLGERRKLVEEHVYEFCEVMP